MIRWTGRGLLALTGRGVRDWSRAGSERAPAYVRLDRRIEREWFFQEWDAVAYMDLRSLINRENMVGFKDTKDSAFPDRLRPIDGVGPLPTFGFSVEY